MKQGEQGQTEGCWRCNGNRTDLRMEKVSHRKVEWNGLVGDPSVIDI